MNPQPIHSKTSDNGLRARTEKGKDNDEPQETARDPRFGKQCSRSQPGRQPQPSRRGPQAGAATTAVSSSTPPTSAAISGLAVVLLSHNTPDVEDDWTVEWQIMNTTSSPSAQAQPGVPSRTGSAGPPPPA